MKIHEEPKFQIVFIIRIDKMRTDHIFGHRSQIQLYPSSGGVRCGDCEFN